MGFQLNTKDYAEYIKTAYERIHENGEYITSLDAATGDGDHWTNLNMGFEKLVEILPEMENLDIASAFKKISMTMMSVIGGSSGVLYGTAYMEAAKAVGTRTVLENKDVCEVLQAMMRGIINRGKANPGDKTMLDTLHHAVNCYTECIEKNLSEKETAQMVKAAAEKGYQSTKDMEAVRGRAYYQANKGVGHLDPGAVTMYYQIDALMDCIIKKIG